MKYFALLFLSIFLFQCTGDQPSQQENTDATAQEEPASAVATAPATKTYPSITNERMQDLWENCDLIDFVFYTTNFSMNQGNQSAIRSTLSGVARTVPVINPSCQPIGRIFFVVDGVNQEEADIFFSDGCVYYIFLDNGTYAFANEMTDAGFAFYKNVFEKVSTQSAG